MSNISIAAEVGEIIRNRRTVKPDKMNGRVIPDDTVLELLQAADWAPTHARTEPWRFVVFGPSQVKEFTQFHADLLKTNSDPATFTQLKYDNIRNLGNNVSHIVIAYMKRVANHKIPEIEEIAAVSAAIQNILIAATSYGIATFWSTGGLTLQPALAATFNLGEEDRILGILYMGYTDEPPGMGRGRSHYLKKLNGGDNEHSGEP